MGSAAPECEYASGALAPACIAQRRSGTAPAGSQAPAAAQLRATTAEFAFRVVAGHQHAAQHTAAPGAASAGTPVFRSDVELCTASAAKFASGGEFHAIAYRTAPAPARSLFGGWSAGEYPKLTARRSSAAGARKPAVKRRSTGQLECPAAATRGSAATECNRQRCRPGTRGWERTSSRSAASDDRHPA